MSDILYDFRSPMLAHTLGEKLPPGYWVAEQKFDGHRLVVSVKGDVVRAWSRLGTPRAQDLRAPIIQSLLSLPDGVYDGELLVPGGTSHNVKEASNFDKLELRLFDILTLGPQDITPWPQERRREALEFGFAHVPFGSPVRLAEAVPVWDLDAIFTMAKTHWKNGSEGLILKDIKAAYRCGKRSRAFLKVKQELSATLEVIGFAASKGEIVDRGLCGQVVLRDLTLGIITAVKTLDDNEVERLNRLVPKDPIRQIFRIGARNVEAIVNHPEVGRLAVIEYQQRTEDSYRHPRWDRWEDE